MSDADSIHFCACGCGTPTKKITATNVKRCLVRGEFRRYAHGHNGSTRRHGLTGSPTYKSWAKIKERCHNPDSKDFPEYGARGIFVCDEWRNSFDCFLADMGLKPRGLTIDRIDNSLGYSKENCRWASPREQANNTRRNVYAEFCGETRTLSEWARITGIHYKALWERHRKGDRGHTLFRQSAHAKASCPLTSCSNHRSL